MRIKNSCSFPFSVSLDSEYLSCKSGKKYNSVSILIDVEQKTYDLYVNGTIQDRSQDAKLQLLKETSVSDNVSSNMPYAESRSGTKGLGNEVEFDTERNMMLSRVRKPRDRFNIVHWLEEQERHFSENNEKPDGKPDGKASDKLVDNNEMVSQITQNNVTMVAEEESNAAKTFPCNTVENINCKW